MYGGGKSMSCFSFAVSALGWVTEVSAAGGIFSSMLEGTAAAAGGSDCCSTSAGIGFGWIGTGFPTLVLGAPFVVFSGILVFFGTVGFLGARGFFCLSSSAFCCCCCFAACSSAVGTFSLMLIFFMPFVKF